MQEQAVQIPNLEEESKVGGEPEWQDAVEELGGVMNTLQLDYTSMEGRTMHRSFRLWGLVANQRVRVLIDSGASHNFICLKLVHATRLEILTTSAFVVKLGNGQPVSSQGRCHGVAIQFPNISITQDFYLFLLEGSELVLGLAWLDTLGDVIANFREARLVL